jgi:methanogenic corrinoid protein MtbC1
MKFLKRLVFLVLLSSTTLNLNAQIEIIDTLTAEELVNDFLLGGGVTATNITFNGLPGDSVYIQI